MLKRIRIEGYKSLSDLQGNRIWTENVVSGPPSPPDPP